MNPLNMFKGYYSSIEVSCLIVLGFCFVSQGNPAKMRTFKLNFQNGALRYDFVMDSQNVIKTNENKVFTSTFSNYFIRMPLETREILISNYSMYFVTKRHVSITWFTYYYLK